MGISVQQLFVKIKEYQYIEYGLVLDYIFASSDNIANLKKKYLLQQKICKKKFEDKNYFHLYVFLKKMFKVL